MASKHPVCPYCGGRYQTINKMVDGASVKCEWCPKCDDTIFTHKQSLELDKLKREKAGAK